MIEFDAGYFCGPYVVWLRYAECDLFAMPRHYCDVLYAWKAEEQVRARGVELTATNYITKNLTVQANYDSLCPNRWYYVLCAVATRPADEPRLKAIDDMETVWLFSQIERLSAMMKRSV